MERLAPAVGTVSPASGSRGLRAAVWRNRFRLGLALLASLAAHAWLAGGLARTPLRLATDAPAPVPERERSRPVPREFTLSVADDPRAESAHERPLEPLLDAALAADGTVRDALPTATDPGAPAAAEAFVPAAADVARPESAADDAMPAPAALARIAAEPDLTAADVTPELPAPAALADGAIELRPATRGGAAALAEPVAAAPPPLAAERDGVGLSAALAPSVSRRPRPSAVVPAPDGVNRREPIAVDAGAGRVAALPPAPAMAAPGGPRGATGSLAELGVRPAARRPTAAAAGGAVTAPRGGDEEALSAESLPPLAQPRRAAAAPSRGQVPGAVAAVTLPRAAAVVLPSEGRVRSIARPHAGRSSGRLADGPADRMIERGLAFLARGQRPDGSWSLDGSADPAARQVTKLRSDTAATGLALLAFLGAGYDHFDGPHHDAVRRGLEWLARTQKPDGDLYVASDPLSDSCAWLYSHAIGTMALCEAVGMTGDPLLRPAAEKACAFIAASQHPERGGWRYTPRSDADLSVSGWMLVALRAGQLAGIAIDPAAIAHVRTFVEASSAGADAGTGIAARRYVYNVGNPQQRPSDLSIACMTALGTLMRLHTGTPVDDPAVRDAAAALAAFEPSYGTRQVRRRDAYLWYYASQVLVHTGGSDWERWYKALCRLLPARQERSGAVEGSWDPLGGIPDRWGGYGGRVYVTALHLLALEVPSRRLPTYDLAPPGSGAAPAGR